MPQLSTHFHSREFNCHDGTVVPKAYYKALEYLCKEVLEPMRTKFGPCTVHSGFRTERYNRRIGGARHSFHIYTEHDVDDVASDVSFAKGSVDDWRDAAEVIYKEKRNGKGGIGFYPQGGFVHLDTRDYISRWDGS